MKLYQHQQDAVQRATEGNLALFHECGTGKTLTALKIIAHHKATGCGPALVVCPLSIIEAAWMADAAKFAPELKVVSLWAKTRKKRLAQLATEADIYIINFESFRGLFSEIQAKGFEVLIVDESSKMKSHSSQITRALLALAGVYSRGKGRKFAVNTPVAHRYILTGTPAPNDRSEYWAQISFVAPNTVFSDNFFAFRSRYFVAKPLGRTGINLWSFTKDPYLSGEFNEKMAPVCDVVSKEDAVDLPDQVHEIRKVKLSKNEQTAYDTFRRDFVLRFADEEVLATTALTELMKARQLTSGFCYGREGAYSIGYSKLKELKSLLEEIGGVTDPLCAARKQQHQLHTDNPAALTNPETQRTRKPVIIWCNFQQEVELLLREIPDALALWGGTDDRAAVIKQFKDGTASCLIANPQSAAHGLTFVNAANAIYYSMTYSYELLKQSQDRIHRIGQKKKCTYHYLLADGTIDEVIYRAVQEKKDLSEAVLAYLKNS